MRPHAVERDGSPLSLSTSCDRSAASTSGPTVVVAPESLGSIGAVRGLRQNVQGGRQYDCRRWRSRSRGDSPLTYMDVTLPLVE